MQRNTWDEHYGNDGAGLTAEAVSRKGGGSENDLGEPFPDDWMQRVKLMGQSLMARNIERQVAAIQLRIAVLNRYTAFGIPVTEVVEQVCPEKEQGRLDLELSNIAVCIAQRMDRSVERHFGWVSKKLL
ncbi:ISSpo9, transposase [Roseobacter sp. SK209-2-6]|nr:ISSpo9, transposase [Roseobacter sp. SK209-2-6]